MIVKEVCTSRNLVDPKLKHTLLNQASSLWPATTSQKAPLLAQQSFRTERVLWSKTCAQELSAPSVHATPFCAMARSFSASRSQAHFPAAVSTVNYLAKCLTPCVKTGCGAFFISQLVLRRSTAHCNDQSHNSELHEVMRLNERTNFPRNFLNGCIFWFGRFQDAVRVLFRGIQLAAIFSAPLLLLPFYLLSASAREAWRPGNSKLDPFQVCSSSSHFVRRTQTRRSCSAQAAISFKATLPYEDGIRTKRGLLMPIKTSVPAEV
ncbi:hypothetical protein CYMTET_36201 [Cymbomonas tetramitiformis]|uniref:Uncharacterized protein n=1 Tax=Cymbomonas tetramitiformis TaxID=36881 RepID=A0AAE0F7N6_9CHLO|nr:hypothetical protein CYMTET_36201 [Cymbomonas tetramitiformis]